MQRKFTIFCILVFWGCQTIPAQDFKSSRDLYLLLGQSNMAGRGAVETVDQQEHPRVLMFTKYYQWKSAREPVQFDKPGLVGVGPGLAFGKAMAEKFPEVTIGLIPAAVGGSSIGVWQKGTLHNQTKIYPFDEALNRAKLAAQNGTLKGIIWHQGESDSKPGLARAYQKNLINLIHRIRKELGHPDLPFVAGLLPPYFVSDNPEAKIVNKAIRDTKGKIKNFSFVNAKGLVHLGDGVHLDANSARELGNRYAEAIEKLIKQ